MVKYNYDAWGNHEVELVDSSYADVAEWNPFRYRGYYYDVETGLYYLNSRYYDPETGRFITIDDLSYIDPDTINGLNLYAYCGNNPVMNVDPTGHDWWEWLWLGLAAAASVVIIAVGTVMTGGTLAILTGGALVGGGIGFLSGAGLSIVSQGISTGWDLNKINPTQALISGGLGAAVGAASGFLSAGIGAIGESIGQAFGLSLSQTSIAGLNVGKAFSSLGGVEMVTGLMGFVGKTAGAFFGGAFANKIVNDMFGIESDLNKNMNDSGISLLEGWFLSWIKTLFRWVRS